MAQFYTCPKCGSHNDPGERCDCERNTPLLVDRVDYMDKRGIVRKNLHTPKTGGAKRMAV